MVTSYLTIHNSSMGALIPTILTIHTSVGREMVSVAEKKKDLPRN